MDGPQRPPEEDTQQPETPPEMDGPQRPPEEDTQQPETPPEMDGPQQPPPDATVSISPTEIALPEVGEQFTINGNIDSKEPVAGYDLYLTFDTTVLKFVEHSITNYIPEFEDYTLEDSMLDEGKLVISVSGKNSTGIGEGALASATFEVLEKKASTIVLSDVIISHPDLSRLDVAISADTVVIQ